MSEEIQTLWGLAGLDERLVGLQGSLARYPEMRRTLEQRLAAERRRLEENRRHLSEFQLKRRQIEKDIEVLTAEERKFQGQLPLIKKNEEYTALLLEIAGAKQRRSERETEALELMDAEDRTQGEKSALDRALAVVERECAERNLEIDALERKEREQCEAIEAERATLLQRLTPATRGRYERIRLSRDGRAVVAIAKGACGGCYRGQPPHVLQEARRGERLLTCEGCGRLLVWPPEGSL